MKQEYFVVVLAHSLRGRLRRVQIPHTAVYAVLGLALLGFLSAFGFVASYARMAWKVANYNALKQEADASGRATRICRRWSARPTCRWPACSFTPRKFPWPTASSRNWKVPSDISSEGKMVPSFAESLQEYNYLVSADKLADLQPPFAPFRTGIKSLPSLWPVEGRLMDGFAHRTDPFSGEGAFHKGVDITAPTGTEVRATADGVVVQAEMVSGRLRALDHHRSWRRLPNLLRAFVQDFGSRRAGSPPQRSDRARWAPADAPPLRTCTTKCASAAPR